jgi:membrane-associated phospholipid phosphatase
MNGTCILLAALCMGVGGCTTLRNGRGWGEDATIAPGWERVGTAAATAAMDPWVWAPLVGAAVFQIDDWDRRTSDWAREHKPVFGSEHNAEQWSDDLRTASALAHYVTVAATPSGPDTGDWVVSKIKGVLVSVAAVSSTVLVTNSLKTTLDRERPNGDDSASLPSGHTSSSAVHTRLASRNLEVIDMSESWRNVADAGLIALTVGTSWARIEAGWHYPSDTLVGMAIGNFLAAFFNDAFLGLDEPGTHSLAVQAEPGGATLQWRWRF